MTIRRTLATTAIVTLGLAFLAASPAQARSAPVPPPPPVAEQIQTTNAMLQPDDLTGLLASTDPAREVGFVIPQGGEDPMPLCRYAEDKYVFLPGSSAVGYVSTAGNLVQNVYVYPSTARATAAVLKARAQLKAHCFGTWRLSTWRTRLVAGTFTSPAGGADGLWVRSDAISGVKKGNESMYVTVVPVGNRVSVVWHTSKARATGPSLRSEVDVLSLALGDRLAGQADLALTQDATLTKGQTDMLQPSDVPPTLPYQRPARGGWSMFDANSPALEGVAIEGSTIAAGTMTLVSALGANEGATPGSIYQENYLYADAAAAQRAWDTLRTQLLASSKTPNAPLSATKETYRLSTGEAGISVDGTPGLWARQFDAVPGSTGKCFNDKGKDVPCLSISTKDYAIYLLVGSTIQEVRYIVTASRITELPLDQAAVDGLALQLAQRWAAD